MFSVKKAIQDADLAPFPFEDADGVPQQLPHARLLSPNQAMRVLNTGDIAEVLIEAGVEPAVAEGVTDLPSHVLEQLVREWMDHSDVHFSGGEPGKSSLPSPPSRSTATPSRRTSRSGGSRSRS